MMTNNTVSNPDFRLSSSPPHQITTNFASPSTPDANYHQNPRKKQSKFIKIDDAAPIAGCSGSGVIIKPKYPKKPDPGAPKITRPCSECGKKFWSWKALFGHMRCHPERQWRGINPPPHFRRPVSPVKESNYIDKVMTEEDHEVAACLLMLANGVGCASSEGDQRGATSSQLQVVQVQDNDVHAGMNCRFECASCKKVFGSHQALGGHRASHKNVKGCFAITRSNNVTCEIDQDRSGDGTVTENMLEDDKKILMYLGHKCSICLRVFSSGQALGGHKRSHWEKGDEPHLNQGLSPFAAAKECWDLDLNLPAPVEDCNSASSSYSSGLTLDLRLGL